MLIAVTLLLGWCLVSLPLGIVVGRLLGRSPAPAAEATLPGVSLVTAEPSRV